MNGQALRKGLGLINESSNQSPALVTYSVWFACKYFIIHYQLHLLHSGMNQEPLRFCIGAVLLQDFKLSDTKLIIYD